MTEYWSNGVLGSEFSDAHHFHRLCALTERNVILVKGRIVFEGGGEELRAKPELLHRHLGI